MPSRDKLYTALKRADNRSEIGFARHLGELYLQKHPDHGPTLIRYASNLIALAQYSLAQEALDHAEAIVPEKYLDLVVAQRGHLLQQQGHLRAAEEMFMRAHKLDPGDATYLIYAGSAVFQAGDIDRAIGLARQATECPEGCIDEAFFNLGGYLLSNRRYHEAAVCYRKALESDPRYSIAKKRLIDVELIIEHQRSLEKGAP